ncbi:SusC/RagA family TonB-linked outer membrane protein [Antarcticibacterium sp. 1MA-6-2]|uniref:SusC/RagA family TonB-linked outer membrane protein n=1 Tax=Antarcticibacterium sp. 1MA-6-2 TaxID=2908210 RepID=UPI001F16E98E|nr:SusC/RagA family TonB-linked outer membrane protein [Antarcticibacterium sp. 1MA-6-2]UJH92668.1 SusC/RagA family TonB-linked outer membrane protein [Antarcticibacterium sp. 1MA-6-2]
MLGEEHYQLGTRYDTDREISFITTLNYDKSFSDIHNITALGGFQQETSKFQRLDASKEGLPSNELHEIGAGSVNPTAGGSTVNYGLQSFFGRVTYNFKEKYLFEANVRYDGSSNFAEGKKWGVFPSFSAGWNIDKESFFNDIDFIDNLKLRGSWGKLGNQAIAPNQYSPRYALGQNYSYGGQLVGGAAQTVLPNPEITWETSTQTDIGLDLRAFSGKLGFVFDYYHKVTDDILRPINVSGVVGGLQAPTVNLASVENKGLEFALSHRNVIGEFSYNVDANLTTINNEVIKLDAPSIGGISWLAEGRPIDEFYTIKMLGIFQNQQEINEHGAQPSAQPGDIKFQDLNNDGEINDEDRQPIASSIPKYTYGLNLSAEYKGFDLSVLFQGVEGNHAITEEEQKPFFNNAGLPKFWVDNAWTSENPNNKYPRLVRGSNYINNVWRNSSFLVEDASYLRLKNFQIGYTLPSMITERINIKRLRVYMNAQNPLTFTSYRGLDPEKNPFQIRGSYSNVQTYSLGLNLSL